MTNETTTKATDQTMANEPVDGNDLNRRGFLKLSGLAAALAVAAAACVEPRHTDQIPTTGTRIPSPSTSVPPFPGSAVLDATLALTALSLELLAVETYTEILDKNWVSGAKADLLRKVQERHARHGEAMNFQASALGQDAAAVKANTTVRKDLVTDQIEGIGAIAGDKAKAENLALKLALSIEDASAQLYARAGGTMTTAALRQTMTGVGASASRLYAAVASATGELPVPFAFHHTAPAAVPSDSYIQADATKVTTSGTTPGSRPRNAG